MGKKDILEILRRFRVALEERGVRVQTMILFGSWVKGTQHEGSDIDVVVVSRDFYGKDYLARVKAVSGAIYNVFAPIQAFTLTPEEWSLGRKNVCDFARGGEVVSGPGNT